MIPLDKNIQAADFPLDEKKHRVILENFTNDKRDPSNPKELLLRRVNVDGMKASSSHVMG